MPTAVNKLDKGSSDAQIKASISDCIATEVHAGHDQDQAIAMCYSMASKKTGKELSKPKGGS